MLSPFPGMDPYIESSTMWGDFHNDLAAEMRAELNKTIQPRYVARLIPYVTYDAIEVGQTYRIWPDVGVWQSPSTESWTGGGTATLVASSPVESLVEVEMPLRLHRVEIRTVDNSILVTAIEILLPVNKRPLHQACLSYLQKRRAILRSGVHLLEIDLLRGGVRPPLERPVPAAPYYVTLSRVERRPRVEVWPIQLADKLPVLPVPLLTPDPDVPLDLGVIVAAVYERGGYASLIDYRQPPPPPPLTDEEAAWLDHYLRERGVRIGDKNQT
ncbi:MAG: DUF4058 family protein [Chloroflexota bacterium]